MQRFAAASQQFTDERQRNEGSGMRDVACKAHLTVNAGKPEEAKRSSPEESDKPRELAPAKVLILGRPTHPPARKKRVTPVERAMDVAIGEEGEPWDEEEEAA